MVLERLGKKAGKRMNGGTTKSVAVVIPVYGVGDCIVDVLARFDDSVHWLFVVDDCCPERTGELVRETVVDPRVCVISNERRLGVGGATAVGFREALQAGAEIIVKLDGDGQHYPEWVPNVCEPIELGEADMVKGNRFINLNDCLRSMPFRRLMANMALSWLSKPATGYWCLSDPANGFLAVHRKIVGRIPWEKIDKGYFFETDLLFHLNMLTAPGRRDSGRGGLPRGDEERRPAVVRSDAFRPQALPEPAEAFGILLLPAWMRLALRVAGARQCFRTIRRSLWTVALGEIE